MPLIHGQHIGATDVEREVSAWDAVRFARLCNAIAWASTWHEAQTLPAFTERVIVADNGVDAYWQRALPSATLVSTPFLHGGGNVFQYKKREVTEQTRSQIVAAIASELRGAILDVERRSSTALSGYVLFTNVDLTTQQHDRLRTAIADGVADNRVSVGVVGAADLAAMLNQLPHLRSAFFATTAFRTWGESWDAHNSAHVFPQAALTGREDALATLCGWIGDSDARVIALTGTHMMGKTRIALEATRFQDVGFIESLDRQALNLEHLRRLEAPGHPVIVLVDDPDAQVAERLARDVLAHAGLKLILCLSTTSAAPAPSFGLDARVRVLDLPPLSEEHSRQLLRAIRNDFDFSLESWILDNADGVPGILLAAAHVGTALRQDTGGFLDQIASGFEREVRERLSQNDQQALSLLSLMSHVGVERDALSEAETLCDQFGVDLNAVLNVIEAFRSAGFLRLAGSMPR
jgi:hypothetical protein